ncbi:hypothetical protein JOL79_06690 [Microbispora sp. RL4-1S]|uniref:Uncharacterized protein n=1 Tax=Microbispora oryzae TaxID=2806554 RepID=A0A941AP99_9ACTN|nr:hypothetical protein [Microbispora oryzae]MBP2703484.1 hypothetical protein [Microbispora oryzae]
MTRIAFLAAGRTGPNPRIHELHELALIERTPGGAERLSLWRLRPQRLPDADAEHLRRTRYFDQPTAAHSAAAIDVNLGTPSPVDPRLLAADLASRLFGAEVVTCDPGRDLPFIGAWLEAHNQLPGWRRSADVTSAAAGLLAGIMHTSRNDARGCVVDWRPLGDDWDAERLAVSLGVLAAPDPELPCHALRRADLARRLYDAVHYGPPLDLSLPAPPDPEPPAELAGDALAEGLDDGLGLAGEDTTHSDDGDHSRRRDRLVAVDPAAATTVLPAPQH